MEPVVLPPFIPASSSSSSSSSSSLSLSSSLCSSALPPLPSTASSTSSSSSDYIPQYIQQLASRLATDHNVEAALQDLRSRYHNLSTLRCALTKLKNAVIHTNVRHASYHAHMAAWEERVKDEVVQELASATSLQRLKEFYAFRDCTLRRQMHIQKKIQLGHGPDFFGHPADVEFVAALRVAPDFVYRIHLDADEARTVHEDQAQKMKKLSATVVRIENADEIVATARRCLKDPRTNVLGAIVGLAIVTGRRMIEILLKGHFAEDPQDRYSIVFQGQAKAGLQELAGIQHDKPMQYSVPVLAPAKTIANAVAEVRAICKTSTMDAKRINSVWCKKLNAYVRQHVHAELGFHDMRTLYALTSFEAFKPHTYSINGWICKTLGHTGLNMSVSYTRMQVYGIHKIRRHNRELAEDFVLKPSRE
jgi:hypothetical protein